MEEILKKLGELVLGSVPTMVLFILLVAAYGFLVRRPLDRILAERRARTAGAIEQARGAMSAAEAEMAVYEDKVRAAKRELLEARERRLKQWAAERDAALGEARTSTLDKVRVARQEIEQGAAVARQQIEGLSVELSAQILRTILPTGVASSEVTR